MSIGKRIAQARHELGMSQLELARRVGMSQTGIASIENGKAKRTLKIAEIAQALGKRVEYFLVGDESSSGNFASTVESVGLASHTAPVVGEVAAGRWMEIDLWDVEKYEPVPLVPTGYEGLEQKAWAVFGNSMDLAGIHHGSFVITVPYFDARTKISTGDVCVVERVWEGKVERTCKEVIVHDDRFELRPNSSDTRWKPIDVDPTSFKDGDGNSVEIIGLVVGVFMRLAKR